MQPALEVFTLSPSSPSSSTTTISPEMPVQFEFLHNSNGYRGSGGVEFTSPWVSSSSSMADYYNLDAFGNSDLSPLSYSDDLLSQFLNEEFTH